MNHEVETTLIPLELRLSETDDRNYIEGIAVPWGRRTDRVAVPELFERGAFGDLVKAGGKIRLTDYNHARDRVPVGYSSAVEDRDAGLWMRFKLNRTPEGESAHANSLEGVYGGLSVGFKAIAERMVNGVRHVTAAWLDHVSLVEEPAYREAVILEVRAAEDAERAAIARDRAEWREIFDTSPMPLDTRGRTSQDLLMAKLRLGSGSHSR